MGSKYLYSLALAVAVGVSGCATVVSSTTGDEAVGTDKSSRTFGRYIDDQLIDTYVTANIKKAHDDFKVANIGVISYNGIVLLVGQVKSNELSRLAEEAARKVRNVRRVHNELIVAGPISIPARANDTWLKSKIKSRMLTTSGVNPMQVKVVMSDSVVYLMGLVSHAEAEQAVAVAHKTYGIQKIVKVFEYVD